MSELSIQSQRVLVDGGLRPASVWTRNGEITDIDGIRDDVDIDCGDNVLMPGIVDTHVHINEPGRTEWEGFVTATRAAAAGGVTTVVDMPLNCIPVTTTADALQQKIDATTGKLQIDVGFWGGVVPAHLTELGALCEAGILGAKAFLCDSGIAEFPESDEATLRAAMQTLRIAGLPLLAHAELESPVEASRLPAQKYEAYLQSRPAKWEVDAIALLIRLCEETGCGVHIVHLSAAEALPQLRAARARGVPITAETCPHYLCLAAEGVPDGDTTYKCAPPIRDEANRDALWAALQDGTIDFVVTDHSPCTPELKKLEQGDFHEAWGGIASLQFGLCTIWAEASRRSVPLSQFCGWLTDAPARFAGLDTKGAIRVGADADFVVWNPDEEREIQRGDILFRHAVSPYIHRTVRGAVEAVYLRGRPIFTRESGLAAPIGRHLLRS